MKTITILNHLKSKTKQGILSALGNMKTPVMSVKEISGEIDSSPNNVTVQLGQLRETGLVLRVKEGRKRLYFLNPDIPETIKTIIFSVMVHIYQKDLKKELFDNGLKIKGEVTIETLLNIPEFVELRQEYLEIIRKYKKKSF